MSIIDDIFQPIYGTPCWSVEQGYGSFLTFEFGQPTLRITEPHEPSEQAPESVRKNAARRFVYVRGEWHFWVHSCAWQIFLHDQEIANHDSDQASVKDATRQLNGQLLTQVRITDAFTTILEFDLGGRLEISPDDYFDETSDLWLLYQPSGNVFTLRADGQYHNMPGNTPPDKHEWKPISPQPSTF